MKRSRKTRILFALFVLGMVGSPLLMGRVTHSAAAGDPSSPEPRTIDTMPALQGDKAIEHLKERGTFNSLQEAIGAIKYQANWQVSPQLAGIGAAYELKNAPNNLLAYIGAGGLQATSLSDKQKSWQLGLQLKDFGYGNRPAPISSGDVSAHNTRVEIRRNNGLTEWFTNTPRGIEHGFTIASAPGVRKESERLSLRLAVSGDLQMTVDVEQKTAVFSRASDNVLLSYDKLFVTDAKQRSLNATMKAEGNDLVVEIDDLGAEYPLTIDPLLRQLQKVTASDGAADDLFGRSVATSGDTAIVGAPGDTIGANVEQGSAYVFTRSGTTWTQQAKLIAHDGAAGDFFGFAVAISGDTAVIGAYQDAVGANLNQGSAYVFVRSGASWAQQVKLTASDGAAGDVFGNGVTINDATIVIGAPSHAIGANLSQGAAYIFQHSGVSWVEHAKLTAGDGGEQDSFGWAVDLSGDSLIVGAPGDSHGANSAQGSAYIFQRSGVSWVERAKLTAGDGQSGDFLGYRVALNGDTAVAAAIVADVSGIQDQGAAYVFLRDGTSWSHQQKLTASDGAELDYFGFSIDLAGDTLVIGSPLDDVGLNVDQGSVYLFTRSGTTWTQQQQLKAADGSAGDGLGTGVAITGDTILAGAGGDTILANAGQGSGYYFICNWTEQTGLTAADGLANDNFGVAVAISRDTAIIGAYRDDVGFVDRGSAYVFIRNGATWTQQQQLLASDGAASDFFGSSVSISGDTIVVGSVNDDINANPDQGSVYVFTRNGILWTEIQKLTASDGIAGDSFGASVSIFVNTIAVGAALDDNGANNEQGSTYVFARNGATFTEQQKLTAADGAAGDSLGLSVALNGETLIAGAPFDDVGANPDQGSAYVFQRNGATWAQLQKLTAADGAPNDGLGRSVAINGDTLVLGARSDDIGANPDQGSAYVFTRSGTVWSQQQKLSASDGTINDLFGNAVAISGDMIVVGASSDNIGANPDQGSAYVFARSGATWFQLQQLLASDGAASDDFGVAVAISGNTIIAGADLNNIGAIADQGSAYIYFMGCNTAPSIAAGSALTRQKGSPATVSTIATVTDGEDPIGFLTVSVPSPPSGIVFTNIVNTNGVITAQISATCNASLGTFTVILRVQDSDGATTTVSLVLSVTANIAPSLGTYADKSVAASGTTLVTPSLAPSDNGSIVEFAASSPTFSGGLAADLDSGVITIDDARPAGTHIITVTAIDNCGSARSRAFVLTVTCSTITVNPATIPPATAGTAYLQSFTNVGGLGAITFSLSGTLPTGLSFNNATATLSGTPTEIGSFSITVTATDAFGCTGSRNYTLVNSASQAVWNGSVSSDWHTAANWTPALAPTSTSDVLIPSAGVTNEPVIANASSSINALTIQASRTLTINSMRQLNTTGDVNTSGLISGAGKFVFDGETFTQEGAVSLDSVEFDAGAHALTGGGAFASGIITVLNGANVTLVSNHSVSVLVINSGGTFDATNQALTLTGAGTPIFNSGSFVATGSTIVYAGAVAQVVTANIAYNNLTLNNTAGLSLAGDTVVIGQLGLQTDLTTGSFTLAMPGTGSSAGTGDVIGNVKRTGFSLNTPLSFGNPFNTILFDSGTMPSDVTVNLVKATPATFSNAVTRTCTVTPNGGAGYSATLRLRYKDSELNGNTEGTLELWRFNGSAWQSPSGAVFRDTIKNWVEESGITAFSPWTIGGPNGPTAVELVSFTATAFDDGVSLEWHTGLEVDNLGFNIYREQGGKQTRINSQLLAGSALKFGPGIALGSGCSYNWWDSGIADCRLPIADCQSAAYWLEDVDLNGKSTWHGPFIATQAAGKQRPLTVEMARTLAALSFTEAPSAPFESRFAQSSALRLSPDGQAQSIIASSPNTVKLQVKSEAWYRVTAQELFDSGLDTSVDPRTLQLFVDGKQQPIKIIGEDDGRFDSADSIEFYGAGLDSPFSELRTYYLIAGKQTGLRISNIQTPAHPSQSGSFPFTVERRDRTIYFSALRNGDTENFFGAVIAGQPVNQSITVNHLAPSAQSAILELGLQGVTNMPHLVSVQVNGERFEQFNFQGQAAAHTTFSIPSSLLTEGINQVTLVSLGGPSDVSLVDYIRLTYQHSLTVDQDRLKFTATAGQQITIDGFTSESISILDVTDPFAVQELSGSLQKDGAGFAVSLGVPGAGQRSLLALTNDNAGQAAKISRDYPSTLRNPAQGADLLIITRRDLFDSALPLIALRQKEGLSVMVVDIDDIYDEFAFGQESPRAVKDFLALSKTAWKKPVRYVLLLGDASYDPKNYLRLGDFDLVPTRMIDTTFLETASDDAHTDLNDDGIADLPIGRLPVRTAAEASSMIDKIVHYEQSVVVEEALLVSDLNDGIDFEGSSEQLIPLIPSQTRITHVRRGQLGDHGTRMALIDLINRGQRIVNYNGHGNLDMWRGVFSGNDALQLTNQKQPAVFVMMNCLNGYFQDPSWDSLGEALMKSSGGAVAVWASSGMTYADAHTPMNAEFYRQVFGRSRPRLGDAVIRAKAATGDADVRRSWVFFGDPTMTFK